jgi:hypothetical protein
MMLTLIIQSKLTQHQIPSQEPTKNYLLPNTNMNYGLLIILKHFVQDRQYQIVQQILKMCIVVNLIH